MIALVFMGPPASGKSTIAREAAEKLGLSHISSGEIARDMSKIDPHTRAELSKGEWAPEQAIRHEILSQIEAAVVSTGDFIIDGFPRRLEQLYILESIPKINPIYFVIECDMIMCLRRTIARKRDDDHPEAVATRFRSYHEYTEPVIGYLYGHSVELDGALPPEVLIEQVADHYKRTLREQ